MLPLIVLVLAIGSGARTFAGEEEAGRLELVLSYPLRRRNAVLAKALAVAAEIAVVCAAGFVALAALDGLVGLDLDFGRLAAALGGLAALGLLYGWLAVALGAAYPSKLLALGIPAGYAAAAYLVERSPQPRGLARPAALPVAVLAGRRGAASERRRRLGHAGGRRARPSWRSPPEPSSSNAAISKCPRPKVPRAVGG